MNRRQALTKAIQALASVPVLGWWVDDMKAGPIVRSAAAVFEPPIPKLGDPWPGGERGVWHVTYVFRTESGATIEVDRAELGFDPMYASNVLGKPASVVTNGLKLDAVLVAVRFNRVGLNGTVRAV